MTAEQDAVVDTKEQELISELQPVMGEEETEGRMEDEHQHNHSNKVETERLFNGESPLFAPGRGACSQKECVKGERRSSHHVSFNYYKSYNFTSARRKQILSQNGTTKN